MFLEVKWEARCGGGRHEVCTRKESGSWSWESSRDFRELGRALSTSGLCLRFLPVVSKEHLLLFAAWINQHWQGHFIFSHINRAVPHSVVGRLHRDSGRCGQGLESLPTRNHYQRPSLDDPSSVARTQSQTGTQVNTTPDSLFSTAQSTKQNTPSTESLRYALGFQEATHV